MGDESRDEALDENDEWTGTRRSTAIDGLMSENGNARGRVVSGCGPSLSSNSNSKAAASGQWPLGEDSLAGRKAECRSG
jgi:hypothetical protein